MKSESIHRHRQWSDRECWDYLCWESHSAYLLPRDSDLQPAKLHEEERKHNTHRYIETQEGNPNLQLAKFIINAFHDKYYSTEIALIEDKDPSAFVDYPGAKTVYAQLLKKYEKKLMDKSYGKENYKFGTVAVRVGKTNAFITTVRGKKDLKKHTYISKVDHRSRKVYTYPEKATLNAPLLHKIFQANKDIRAIVHYHEEGNDDIPHFSYAPSGTVRDTLGTDRMILGSHRCDAFEIEGHGRFELLDWEGSRVSN